MATKTKRNRKPSTRVVRTGDKSAGARRTKADTILDLLQRSTGASIGELTKATGWQPHSVRAALTGLRKKGREVARTKDEKGTRYRIAAKSGR